jgi:hypothetical protein
MRSPREKVKMVSQPHIIICIRQNMTWKRERQKRQPNSRGYVTFGVNPEALPQPVHCNGWKLSKVEDWIHSSNPLGMSLFAAKSSSYAKYFCITSFIRSTRIFVENSVLSHSLCIVTCEILRYKYD